MFHSEVNLIKGKVHLESGLCSSFGTQIKIFSHFLSIW